MKKIILFIVALFTIGVVNSGLCQIRPGTTSITPYVGGYTFEGNLDLDTSPVYGLKLGYDFTKHFGGEFVLGVVRTHYTEPINEVKTFVYNGRVEGLYHFMPDNRLVPFVAAGIGAQQTDYQRDIRDKWRFVGDYGVGVKYFWTDSIALRADVRHILASGSIYNNLEYTLGLSFLFGGVKPAPAVTVISQPEPLLPAPKPEPALRAPLAKPLSLSAVAKSDSEINLNWNCVEGATGYKVYRDGGTDAFPSKGCSAADKGLKGDTRYCYQVSATDDEARESAFSNQDCAKTAAPPAPVMELKKPAETAAAAAVAKQIIEKGRATIDIKFDFDKAVVKPMYHKELEKFAEVLKNHPELNLIIEGHTDAVGTDDYNLKLSQKRAESVRAYLIKKFGVEENRLTAKGYGEARPIYSNKIAAGRAKNRRVEAAADYVIKK